MENNGLPPQTTNNNAQTNESVSKNKSKEEIDIINQNYKKVRVKVWLIMIAGLIAIAGIVIAVLAFNGASNGSSNIVDFDDGQIKKPIIYLYPEKETEVVVRLGAPEKLTASYPKYVDGWDVMAYPNGDLIDKTSGNKLYSLYWEGRRGDIGINIGTGFVVKGGDSAKFLEEKLEILGLNYKEKEEFIVYWLPKLEANNYNYIYFATAEEIAKDMPLELSVKPDTMIRVSMMFEGLDGYVEVPEQVLTPAPERKGFTVVEWGGTEL